MSFTRKVLKMDTIPEVIRSALFPSGFIAWFNRTSAPNGWVICNGKWYSADGLQSSDTETSTCSIKSPNLIGKYALGATSDIGDSVAAGLPNITGEIDGSRNSVVSEVFGETQEGLTDISGSFKNSTFRVQAPVGTNHTMSCSALVKIDFDASESNPIYGSSDTVTPPSVKLLPCMKL